MSHHKVEHLNDKMTKFVGANIQTDKYISLAANYILQGNYLAKITTEWGVATPD